MDRHSLRRKLGLALVLAVVLLLLPPTIAADGPTRLNSMSVLMNLRTPACSTMDPMAGIITAMTPDSTLIHDADGCGPVVDADGNQLTLGAFKAAEGTVSAECIEKGSHTTFRFVGLVPKGVYTVWLFVFDESPGLPPPVAVGAIGTSIPNDARIKNIFRASESGQGQISLITEAGQLSANMGPFDGCLLDEVEVHLALVYHHDGLTNGPVPGPTNTWVAQEVVVIN